MNDEIRLNHVRCADGIAKRGVDADSTVENGAAQRIRAVPIKKAGNSRFHGRTGRNSLRQVCVIIRRNAF